ncbi:cell division protein ZapE [Shewanella sp.]|uniref:cell division protein ZapE n=1 Tax=Shewanella sp. TaxID=50422 RepID=UPI004053EA02
MMQSPLTRYLGLCRNDIVDDPAQHQALEALETLYQLWVSQQASQTSISAHSRTNRAEQINIIKGVYLWGDVGRGKTLLMDIFYQAVSEEQDAPVLRLHFHRFMALVHKKLNQTSGKGDPLLYVAKELAAEYRLICFDEFFVADIGDAILLGRLFDALFNAGVVLVATSNIPIVELYKNGLQRDRFLPAITLLQGFNHEIHLSGQVDHRLAPCSNLSAVSDDTQRLEYLSLPSKHSPQIQFTQLCAQLSVQAEKRQLSSMLDSTVRICQRDIPIKAQCNSIAWFEFQALCQGPRSALDYIEIAEQFSHILLSEVPRLGGELRSWIRARGTEDGALATPTGERQLAYAIEDDPARRFISLVDELYDQKVTLVLNSQWPLDELYQDGALKFEFRRTYSRLVEMQRWL